MMTINPAFAALMASVLSSVWNFFCMAFVYVLSAAVVVVAIVLVCMALYFKDKEAGVY